MQYSNFDNTYKKTYTQYFDSALIFYGIFYAIKESQLDYLGLHIITYPMLILSIGFSLLSIFHNFKWNLLHSVAFVLLFFIPLYLRLQYSSNVLISTMLILAAYNIPFRHIAKVCVRVTVIVFLIVILALALGIIEDRVYYRDKDLFENSYAHDIGFKYYSYSYLGMGIVQCCIYQWRKHLSIIKIAFLILFSCVFFFLTSTRLQLYACTAFIFAVLILPYIPKKIWNNKLLAIVAVFAYPLICIALYFVSKYFILSLFYDGYEKLNKIMSSRLRLNEEAFMRYDVTLWGNNLEFDTAEWTNDYFYIDSGYLNVLLGDGLVFTGIILLLYAVLTYKIFMARAYYLYIWILLYAILNISNGFLVSILANPIILLAFSDIEAIRNDYYSEKKTLRLRKYVK